MTIPLLMNDENPVVLPHLVGNGHADVGSGHGLADVLMLDLHGRDGRLEVRGMPLDVEPVADFELAVLEPDAGNVGFAVIMVDLADFFFPSIHNTLLIS